MLTDRTFYSAGLLLVFVACSSSPQKSSDSATGSDGNGAGPGTGATGATGDTGGGAKAGNGANEGGGTSQTGGGTGGGSSQPTGGTNGQTGGTNGQTGGASGQTGGTNNATGGAGGACANEKAQATAVPPVLQFVIDVTTSMTEDAYPDDSTRNASKIAELKRILPPVIDTFPANWAVGLQFFSYNSGSYRGSQAVPINPLTAAQNGLLDTAINGANANGYTPTYAAWSFALGQVNGYNNPDYATSPRAIVLITDGVPTVTNDGCTIQNPIRQQTYDDLIAQVRANSGNVKTYVIGVLGSQDPQGATYDPMYELSLLADAGGTAKANCTPRSGTPSGGTVNPRGTYCHFDLTSNPDFGAGLQQALEEIVVGQVTCSYNVPPTPTDGRVFDFTKIQVAYTPNGGTARDLVQAPDQNCQGGQWFVSATNPTTGNPAKLDLCPDTCATAKGDPGSQISITFVCKEVL